MLEVSYSEYTVFRTNFAQYYKQYILGIKDAPSRPMILGTILHEACLLGKPFREPLTAHHFTADYIRSAEKLVGNPIWGTIPQKEVTIVSGEAQARLDGLEDGIHTIDEFKTSEAHWSQARADQHDQLTFYGMVYLDLHGLIPAFRLISGNVKNGKIVVFDTTRTPEQIEAVRYEVNAMVAYLKHHGLWEKRKKNKR